MKIIFILLTLAMALAVPQQPRPQNSIKRNLKAQKIRNLKVDLIRLIKLAKHNKRFVYTLF